MENTNDDNTEEKSSEQLPINAIELLKDNIGYNEFVKFYELFLGKNNKGIDKKIAAILSVSTLFFWICKVIYFSYLSGVNCYYGISNQYIHINDNLGYQVCQFIVVTLIVGKITIVFMNIWLKQTSKKIKIGKSIGLALLEALIFFVGVCLNTYGLQYKKIINEIKNYSILDVYGLIIMLICLWIVVHYYAIVILISYKKNRNVKKVNHEYKRKHKKKESDTLLKANIVLIFRFSFFLFIGAWIYGNVNEMLRTDYNVIMCSSFDEKNTNEDYIFENDDKKFIAYVVISDENDYLLCKRLTNKYTIKSNGISFIKREGAEIVKVKKHFNKN